MAFNAKRAIAVAAALLAALLFVSAVQAGPYDPGFHIFTPGHWINDPNGPYRDTVNGKIHLYMQYNPNGALWGDMSWYHVTSKDYVYWTPSTPNVSMFNDRWYDDWGVYSGTMMNNNYSEPVAVYTCVETVNVQRQCIANPIKSDLAGKRDFDTLIKSPLNPVMTEDDVPGLVGLENFRDPTEWWPDPAHEGRWLIAFVARIDDDDGDNAHVIVFYTEDPTFQSGYTFSHTLYMYKYDVDHMFECPDFFTVDSTGEHFLKVSTMPSHRDYIVYGSYELDAASGEYVFVEDPTRSFTFMDYGPWYAAKTFHDPILKRRMVWGWVNEELSDEQIVAQGYSGLQILRDIAYDSTERMLKYPPLPEIKGLRTAKLYENRSITLSSETPVEILGVTDSSTIHQDIVASFDIPSTLFDGSQYFTDDTAPEVGLRIRVNADSSEYTTVSLRMPAATQAAISGEAQDTTYPVIKTYNFVPTDAAAAATNCSGECVKDRLCESWTVTTGNSDGSATCNQYWKASDRVAASASTSGTVNVPWLYFGRTSSGTTGATKSLHGRAPLTQATPTNFTLRVLVDNSVIEVYKDDGLQTLSGRLYIADGTQHSGISVYARNMGGNTVTADVVVYSMDSIWAKPEPANVVRNFTNSLYDLLSTLVDV